MMTRSLTKVLLIGLAGFGTAASAEPVGTATYTLRLQVPLACTVRHESAIAPLGAGYVLGQLREFCNAPQGYSLVVNYAPGSLKGAVIAVGEERITLDGSGREIISRSTGPRIRDRAVYAEAGPDGFNTDRLDFLMEAG